MDVVNVENAGAIFHQRKVSKRKPPDAACFLRSGSFIGVCTQGHKPKGTPVPPAKCGIPAAPFMPFGCSGLFPTKPPVLGVA